MVKDKNEYPDCKGWIYFETDYIQLLAFTLGGLLQSEAYLCALNTLNT
jgi:hypothetical protein